MNIETFRSYCLAKKGVNESLPFGEDALVFKVMHKIFAITNLNTDEFSVNLKCDPRRSIELRERFAAIIPGYHMNKKHWNTINFGSDLPEEFLFELIDHSYDLVVNTLKRSVQEELRMKKQ